jgi:hypothetical protein
MWAVIGLLVAASAARADDFENMAMARVRLSTETAAATGCNFVGRVSDDSVKDLRRKIVRAGGNAAVISFDLSDMSVIHAQVYRCAAPAAAPRVPPGVPPPPPGTPPPPPPPPPPSGR